MKKNLKDLTGDLELLSNIDSDDKIIKKALEDTKSEINKQCIAIDGAVKGFDERAAGIDTEIKRLTALKKSINSRKENLISFLRMNMEQCEINKIEWPTGSVNLDKPKPMLKIDDESLIPDKYISVKFVSEYDKKQILDDLKLGVEVPGCRIIASKRPIRIR